MKWRVFPWEEMLSLGKRVVDLGEMQAEISCQVDTLCLRIPHEF